MVKAWVMTNNFADQRDECHKDPPEYVSLETLTQLGVEHFYIPVEKHQDGLAEISELRGYNYNDKITISRDKLPNYESKIRQFFDEHLHTDEEVRYIVEGCGYFDVRSQSQEQWIRILSEPGDLLIIPAGIYHRFTINRDDYIHVIRLFQGEPVWTPYNRSAEVEKMAIRREYLETLAVGSK